MHIELYLRKQNIEKPNNPMFPLEFLCLHEKSHFSKVVLQTDI